MAKHPYPADRFTRARIAAEACTDARTVERVLRGERTCSTTFHRIREALARMGLTHLIPTTPNPEPQKDDPHGN